MNGPDRSRRWTKRVDDKLTKILGKFDGRKVSDWNAIADSLNEDKGAKSCRLRWENQLHPNINHSPVEVREDELILKAVEEHGHAWATIARLLSDRKARQMAETGQKGPFCRTDNWVKNRWHFYLSGKVSPSRKRKQPRETTDCKVACKSRRVQAVPLPDLPMTDSHLPYLPLSGNPLPEFPSPEFPSADSLLPDNPLSNRPLPYVPLGSTPLPKFPSSEFPSADPLLPATPLSDGPLSDLPLSGTPLAEFPSPAFPPADPLLPDTLLSDRPLSDLPMSETPLLDLLLPDLVLPDLPAAPWAESRTAPLAAPPAGFPAEPWEAYMSLLHREQLRSQTILAAQPTSQDNSPLQVTSHSGEISWLDPMTEDVLQWECVPPSCDIDQQAASQSSPDLCSEDSDLDLVLDEMLAASGLQL